ncbi:MAG: AtpZ/AtpI family protein [Bacteroidia bacterium]|nr:AtpZ/AtpI family protein [Bacteroidia bacterium]
MAFQMIATILIFTFLGRYIDTYKIIDFQIFTVVGVLLGLSIALYQGFKSIKQIK